MNAKEIPTPFFLIDECTLHNNLRDFEDAFRESWENSKVSYSVKTNSLPYLINWMNNNDVAAEVVSDEEFGLSELSGVSPDNIVFNGPIKGKERFLYAIENGSTVNIDSKHELDVLEEERPEIRGMVGLRLNIDPSLFSSTDVGYQEDGFRFGFGIENGEFERALNRIKNVYGDMKIGLHIHVNSITRAVDVYRTIAEFASEVIDKYDMEPPFIDIGGGFFGGVEGKPGPRDYIRAIKTILLEHVDPSYTRLIVEPGSALVGSAVEYYTKVLDVKDTDVSRIVTTDGSRIHIDPLWGKRSYKYSTSATKEVISRQVVCGYTCMDHDRIMVLDDEKELSVGDTIKYHRVGNYTTTMGGPFIRPLPAVYSRTESGEIVNVRKPMTVEEFYLMEAY